MPIIPDEERLRGLDYAPERELLTFDYRYKGLEIPVSVWLEPNFRNMGNAVINISTIKDDDYWGLGQVTGFYQENNAVVNFYVVTLLNETIDDNSGASAGLSTIPRVVGITIGELIARGAITAWHSSNAGFLSDSARDMYERYLKNRDDLNVQMPTEEYPAYIVTAKQS